MAVSAAQTKKLTDDYLKKVDALTIQYKKDIADLMKKINDRKIADVRKKLQ